MPPKRNPQDYEKNLDPNSPLRAWGVKPPRWPFAEAQEARLLARLAAGETYPRPVVPQARTEDLSAAQRERLDGPLRHRRFPEGAGVDVPVQNTRGKATRQTARVGTFSEPAVPVPKAIRRRRRMTSLQKARARQANQARILWEKSPEGRQRMRGFRELSEIKSIAEWYNALGLNANLGDPPADMGRRNHPYGVAGRSQWQREAFAAVDAAPRERHPDIHVVMRWEDYPPILRMHAMTVAARYGVTMRSMQESYGALLDQANMEALMVGYSKPWGRDFYTDSEARTLFDKAIEELGNDRAWPEGVNPAAVYAMASALTSRRTKFMTGQPENREYPNHKAAMAVIRHVLTGSDLNSVLTADDVAVGVINWTLNDAAAAVREYMTNGMNADGDLLRENKKPYFSSIASKVKRYMAEIVEPDGPDSGLVHDTWATRAMVPHLSTEESTIYRIKTRGGGTREVPFYSWQHIPFNAEAVRMPARPGQAQGPLKKGASPLAKFIRDGGPALGALMDYIARRAHVERGMSPSMYNAQSINKGQATVWVEGQMRSRNSTITVDNTYVRDGRRNFALPLEVEQLAREILPDFVKYRDQNIHTLPEEPLTPEMAAENDLHEVNLEDAQDLVRQFLGGDVVEPAIDDSFYLSM